MSEFTYCVAGVDRLVAPNDSSRPYVESDFFKNPKNYHSAFLPFAKATDILLCCHFWDNEAPVYLDVKDYEDSEFRIRMIGDVSCDIMGSIKSTLRPSTHANPFYDYNRFSHAEETAFSSDENVTVMAVDTCPNALPRVTSEFFGSKLIEHVLDEVITTDNDHSEVLDRATILAEGKLTPRFAYLHDYVKEFAEID